LAKIWDNKKNQKENHQILNNQINPNKNERAVWGITVRLLKPIEMQNQRHLRSHQSQVN
jgi:hypothetical protein